MHFTYMLYITYTSRIHLDSSYVHFVHTPLHSAQHTGRSGGKPGHWVFWALFLPKSASPPFLTPQSLLSPRGENM